MPVEPTLVDAELHRRLVYGDESALAEVYAAYGALVRRVAVRVTRSPAAAEDVAQEVFAQLWSRPYAFDARRGSLRTWLSMLAHRRATRSAPVAARPSRGPCPRQGAGAHVTPGAVRADRGRRGRPVGTGRRG